MMEQRLLPQIARIVLTPYEPTALHRWWNKRRRKKLGITPEDDVEAILSAPEFAEAVADFFVINVGWLESWLNTPMGSGLDFRRSIVKMTPAGAIASLSRSFGQLATATWIRPSASDGSPS
jgi:hypothetical protein